jgi:predicted RNA binding protein with dsRBD fold (UPF0201 family)
MNIDKITKAISNLVPNSEFTFERDDLTTLIWHSETAQPSIQEIEAEITRLENQQLQQETLKASEKAALLKRLGITADEAALLLA